MAPLSHPLQVQQASNAIINKYLSHVQHEYPSVWQSCTPTAMYVTMQKDSLVMVCMRLSCCRLLKCITLQHVPSSLQAC